MSVVSIIFFQQILSNCDIFLKLKELIFFFSYSNVNLTKFFY